MNEETDDVLVAYTNGITTDFAQRFGKILGYTHKEVWKWGDNVHVYSIPTACVDQAIQAFQSQTPFTQWATRRETIAEERWKELEERISALQALYDDASELTEQEYANRLHSLYRNS